MAVTSKNKKRFAIGVDFDDVIFRFNDAFHSFHNGKYGTNNTRENITSFDIEKILNCTPEEVKDKTFEFMVTPAHADALPIDGSKEALARLSKKYELHIITARGDQMQDVTVSWIEKHFPKHFESINLTNQFFGIPEKMTNKIAVCNKLGIKLMVEDSPRNARSIAEAGIQVILLDAPWNQEEMPNGVTRVYSWAEIVAEIDRKATKLS